MRLKFKITGQGDSVDPQHKINQLQEELAAKDEKIEGVQKELHTANSRFKELEQRVNNVAELEKEAADKPI